jgi:hypothetical protein
VWYTVAVKKPLDRLAKERGVENLWKMRGSAVRKSTRWDFSAGFPREIPGLPVWSRSSSVLSLDARGGSIRIPVDDHF